MIKTVIAISLVAMTSAVAGQLKMANSATDVVAFAERTFMSPRVEGRRLDVRFNADQPRQPVDAAREFCRANGFDTVVGYSMQAASSTRTIADMAPHTSEFGHLKAFYAIRCSADSTAA